MSKSPAPKAPPDSTAPAPTGHPLEDHVGYALRRAQLAVFQDFCDSTEDLGLRPAEYSILAILGARPGTRHRDLSELLSIKPANCVILIDKLEARGLVVRKKLRVSGRAVALSLTAKGNALLRQANARVDAHRRRIQDRLGADDVMQLLSLLSRLY